MKPCMDRNRQWEAIHAGLECGLFYEKLSGLNCVSFGPNMKAIHTTEERLSISLWRTISVPVPRSEQLFETAGIKNCPCLFQKVSEKQS